MSRRPQDFRGAAHGIKEIRESREKAEAERRRSLERFKQHHTAVDRERLAQEAFLAAKRGRFNALIIADALTAARRLTFVDLEAEGALRAIGTNAVPYLLKMTQLPSPQQTLSNALIETVRRIPVIGDRYLLSDFQKSKPLGIVGFIAIQFVDRFYEKFQRSNPPVTTNIVWDSPETEELVRTSCFDCHSNETVYPWYAYVKRITFRKPESKLTEVVPAAIAQWGARIEALPYFDKTYPAHWR